MYVNRSDSYYLDCWNAVRGFIGKDWKIVLKKYIDDNNLWEDIHIDYKEKTVRQVWKEKKFGEVADFIFHEYQFEGFIEDVVEWKNSGEIKEWVFSEGKDLDYYEVERIKVGVETEKELIMVITDLIKSGVQINFNDIEAEVLQNLMS